MSIYSASKILVTTISLRSHLFTRPKLFSICANVSSGESVTALESPVWTFLPAVGRNPPRGSSGDIKNLPPRRDLDFLIFRVLRSIHRRRRHTSPLSGVAMYEQSGD